MGLQSLIKVMSSRVLPQAQPDGSEQLARGDRYGSPIVMPIYPDFSGLVDEGSYYVVTASAVAGPIIASYAATTPMLLVQNNDSNPAATAGKRIFLDFIKWQVTTAPASGTNAQFQINTDTIPRFSSGGTVQSPVNVNTGANNASIAKVYLGTPTALAAGANVRLLDQGTLRTVIPAIGDIMIMNFGGVEKVVPPTAISAAGPAIFSYCVPPVAVDPGHAFMLTLFFASNSVTGQSANWTIGFWER